MILQRELGPLVFSDESRFCEGPDNSWCYVRRGEWNSSVYSEQTKFQSGLMFFGAISERFKSDLVLCSNGVGAQEYLRTLQACGIVQRMNSEYGCGRWLYMQDGAPAHTASSTIKALDGMLVLLGGWPASSCDLNPIEMMWALIKKRLNAGAHQDLPLADRVIRLWGEIPQLQETLRDVPRCARRVNLAVSVFAQGSGAHRRACRARLQRGARPTHS